MNIVQTFNFTDGATLKVFTDDGDIDSPRDWDNVGKFYCFHKRYNLGDKHTYRSADYNGWDEFREALEADHDVVAIFPVYMMDHSGLTVSIGSNDFSRADPVGWDWGQIGFIFATREDVLKAWEATEIDGMLLDKVKECLKAEVRTFDQYLTGDVYCFLLEKDGKMIENCGGFYGSDIMENGIVDNIPLNYAEEIRAAS